MKYEIITERFEIEKMAEDMFLSDDEILVHIDYVDLRTLNKTHSLYLHSIFRETLSSVACTRRG